MVKKEKRDISHMIDNVKYNGNYDNLTKNQRKRLDEMMHMPMNNLPELAIDYLTAYSRKLGLCGEVCLCAYSEYIVNYENG
jgi:hypothetical protein